VQLSLIFLTELTRICRFALFMLGEPVIEPVLPVAEVVVPLVEPAVEPVVLPAAVLEPL
jgi:hypothetical protein